MNKRTEAVGTLLVAAVGAFNFGWWQQDINAGVFAFILLLGVWANVP